MYVNYSPKPSTVLCTLICVISGNLTIARCGKGAIRDSFY